MEANSSFLCHLRIWSTDSSTSIGMIRMSLDQEFHPLYFANFPFNASVRNSFIFCVSKSFFIVSIGHLSSIIKKYEEQFSWTSLVDPNTSNIWYMSSGRNTFSMICWLAPSICFRITLFDLPTPMRNVGDIHFAILPKFSIIALDNALTVTEHCLVIPDRLS